MTLMKIKFSIENIEKKVRKQIRLHNLISKGDVLYIIDDGRLTNVTVYYMLKEIIKDPTIKIRLVKKLPELIENRKYVMPYTMEKESSAYLSEFVNDENRREENAIKPLIRVTLEECRYYCDKKGLGYEDEKIEDEPISNFVQRLQSKYDSTMHSLIKSEETLKK